MTTRPGGRVGAGWEVFWIALALRVFDKVTQQHEHDTVGGWGGAHTHGKIVCVRVYAFVYLTIGSLTKSPSSMNMTT